MDPKGCTTFMELIWDPFSKNMPKTYDYTELYKEIAKDHSNLVPPELTIKALMLSYSLIIFAHFLMTQKAFWF